MLSDCFIINSKGLKPWNHKKLRETQTKIVNVILVYVLCVIHNIKDSNFIYWYRCVTEDLINIPETDTKKTQTRNKNF